MPLGLPKKKALAKKAISVFQKEYARAWTSLNYNTPFQLLISVILSAQCTDARVNMITPLLFSKYPNAKSLAKAKNSDVENIVHSTGFYRAKAKNIIRTSQIICNEFEGEVPNTMEGLLSLAGVARKTANIVLFHSFSKSEGIAVDTHCLRISYRLGLTSKRHNQNLSEKELMEIISRKYWGMYTNWMVLHGRKYCISQKPKCNICPLSKICLKKGVLG